MFVKKSRIILLIIIIISITIALIILKKNLSEKKKKVETTIEVQEDFQSNSNIIKDVNYTTTDIDGNEYIINALEGEIDYKNSNIIYLTNVSAQIVLNNSEIITIISDYGKYNSENYDTIFSKNVIINYLDNEISSEYLDFSLERNSMIISKNVVYTNLNNILKADVVEINIKTKDTKIFMYENEKKVNIKSRN